MYSKVIVVGNLGRDPEGRYTQGGTFVSNFSVATNRKFTDQAGIVQKKVTWYRVAAWGKLGEAAQEYLKKGRQVLVEGELVADENGNPRVWTGQDGLPRASFELSARVVRFLGSRPEGAPESVTSDQDVEALDDDEIPF